MKKPKVYTLDVCVLYDLDTNEKCELYSKGHHDPFEFSSWVKTEMDTDIDPSSVIFGYGRYEMVTGPDGPTMILANHSGPGRGIFPITYAMV